MADSMTLALKSLVAQVRSPQQISPGSTRTDAESARVSIAEVRQAGQDAKDSLRNGYRM